MSIAVVVPTYNSGVLLRETLDSILNQTLPPDEVLVVDDGSTDGTREMAAGFGTRVRVLLNPGKRQAANRNFGVANTDCEWIAFLDHDDLWEPNKLERQMQELQRKPGATCCYTARARFTEDTNGRHVENVIEVPAPDEVPKALCRNTVFLPGSVVIRRESFTAAGGFDPHYKLVEDWDFWLRLMHVGTVFAYCPEPLLLHRVHARNQSNAALAALAESDEIFRRHIRPRMSWLAGELWHCRVLSEHETEAALTLRLAGGAGYLPLMLRAIGRDPFHDPHRLKIALHMLYTTLRRHLISPSAG